MDRGAWWAAVHGSHRVGHDRNNLACMYASEKEMATHSSVLAWRIPGTEEPGGLPSVGLHRVRYNCSNLVEAVATGVSGVLKSPTIIVSLSISPFMSVSVYLVY